MKKMFGLPQTVFTLGLVSLLTDLSSEMIYPILPLFLANVIGVSTTFIGLVEGIAESTASLLKIFSGWLSDKLGKRKQLILAGYGFSSITKPFMALATAGWHVLGLRFLDRLGKGVRGAPRDAMIADVTDPGERGKAFGFHRAMDTMGAIIGPAAAFIILSFTNDGYRPLFLIATIPAMIAVGIIVTGVRDEVKFAGSSPSPLPSPIKGEGVRNGTLRQIPRNFVFLLIIIGIFTLGNSSDAFLILRAQGIGVDVKLIPILWLFFNLIYTLVSMPAGSLSDRIGRRRVILIGFAVYSLCYAGFAFASKAWHAWLLFGIYGIYYGMTEGVIRAYIADIIPRDIRATSYGIYNFVVGVLLLPANLLTGFIWKTLGPTAAFGFGATLALAATAGFACLKFAKMECKSQLVLK